VHDTPFAQDALLGVVTTLFGIVVLAWPDATIRVLAVVVGIWLLMAGLARILWAFVPGRGVGRQVLSGIVGVLLVVAGAACLRDLAKGVLVLAWIVGMAWLLSGLAALVVAALVTGPPRTWLIVVGLISVLLGIAFMAWPGLSVGALVLLTGISALVVGVGEIVVAIQLRRRTPAPQH
jgi:uncharacterized membrane protein HdeD (DUF308 family)